MVSLVGADNNDISFTDHVHRSITVHEKQLSLKYCYHALKVELLPSGFIVSSLTVRSPQPWPGPARILEITFL